MARNARMLIASNGPHDLLCSTCRKPWNREIKRAVWIQSKMIEKGCDLTLGAFCFQIIRCLCFTDYAKRHWQIMRVQVWSVAADLHRAAPELEMVSKEHQAKFRRVPLLNSFNEHFHQSNMSIGLS